jgi:hypothetical protein
VNSEVAGLARTGPIRSQADAVMDVIASSLTAVHLVTLLEEMPVQETADGVADLREAKLPVGGLVVNQVRRPLLSATAQAMARKRRLETGAIAQDLARVGIVTSSGALAGSNGMVTGTDVVDALVAEAADHAERVALESRERDNLESLARPTYELPFLPDGIDLGALYELADQLRQQGMA